MLRRILKTAKNLKNTAIAAKNRAIGSATGANRQREVFDNSLGGLVAQHANSKAKIVVDGSFENEGYFFRLALLMSALGASSADCVGVLGRYKAADVRRTMRSMGLTEFVQTGNARARSAAASLASALLAQWQNPGDILSSQLPGGVPGMVLYDCLLKRQRLAVVNLRHETLREDLADFLQDILDGEDIVRKHKPDMLILSHINTGVGAGLAWTALKENIEVVFGTGGYGSPRFCRISSVDEFYSLIDAPVPEDINELSEPQREALASIGAGYLEARYSGKTDDISGIYAFGSDTSRSFDPHAQFGWRKDVPVVGIFSSNFFDYPHASGMRNFRDIADWLDATVEAASQNTDVNWLIRGHPCDAWYKGITIRDVIAKPLPAHVQFCDPNVSGRSVLAIVDAAVTFHGTVGIEYASFGKEVLVADVGWYHRFPFVVWPATREAYLRSIRETGKDGRLFRPTPLSDSDRRLAQIFVGLMFCLPEWQKGVVLPDDSSRNAGIPRYLELLDDPAGFVGKEIRSIRAWIRSGSKRYHTFKTKSAEALALPISKDV